MELNNNIKIKNQSNNQIITSNIDVNLFNYRTDMVPTSYNILDQNFYFPESNYLYRPPTVMSYKNLLQKFKIKL